MKRIVYTNKKGESTTSYAAAQTMGATKISYEEVDTRSKDFIADQEKLARKRMSAYKEKKQNGGYMIGVEGRVKVWN